MTPTRSDARRRLSRSADFEAAYRQGRSVASRHLVVYAFRREGDPTAARLGVAVSRKVGGAVERNRLRRQLREAFAGLAAQPHGVDLVVVARPGLPEAVEANGFAWLGAELAGLVGRLAEPAP